MLRGSDRGNRARQRGVTASPPMTVRGIGKAFGGERVLADVSFEVASGEILG